MLIVNDLAGPPDIEPPLGRNRAAVVGKMKRRVPKVGALLGFGTIPVRVFSKSPAFGCFSNFVILTS
jgi:hypothetical protein